MHLSLRVLNSDFMQQVVMKRMVAPDFDHFGQAPYYFSVLRMRWTLQKSDNGFVFDQPSMEVAEVVW